MARKKKPPKPKAHKVKKPRKPRPVHLRHRSTVGTPPHAAGEPFGHVSTAGVTDSGAAELLGAAGLMGVILEVVGEHGLSVGQVLSAWQLEQDRVANRAWRRPGGLARMAGL